MPVSNVSGPDLPFFPYFTITVISTQFISEPDRIETETTKAREPVAPDMISGHVWSGMYIVRVDIIAFGGTV